MDGVKHALVAVRAVNTQIGYAFINFFNSKTKHRVPVY